MRESIHTVRHNVTFSFSKLEQQCLAMHTRVPSRLDASNCVVVVESRAVSSRLYPTRHNDHKTSFYFVGTCMPGFLTLPDLTTRVRFVFCALQICLIIINNYK